MVGALDHNVELVLEALGQAEAEGCDLAVFAELAITGYPPEDLIAKRRFIADNKAAVARVAEATGDCAVVIGFVDSDDDAPGNGDGRGAIYNAAAICANGEIKGTYRKQHLPNYTVFDEKRYFVPGTSFPLWSIAGVTVGVSICEDMWVDNGPCPELARRGAQVLININASPYHYDKREARDEVIAARVAEAQVPFVYVNLVGAQDELVFDGASCVFDAAGEPIARSPQFADDVMVADFEVAEPREVTGEVTVVTQRPSSSLAGLPPKVAPLLGELDEIWEALVLGARDYVHNNGFSDVCFGLSGGIDSAITACIAADAFGPEHVHAVMMPSRYSSDHSVSDSEALCANLGIDGRTIAIEPGHQAFLDMLAPSFEGLEPGLTEENLQSRIRGVTLMALANKFGWLVLTTGNKSELAVGYSTLYGDTAGAFAVIKDVWKLKVYELSRHYNVRAGREIIPEHILTKAPSAELRPDQRDDQSLPPYEELDPMLIQLVEQNRTAAELIEDGADESTVRRIARLVDIAEFKRRQSPLGTRISPRAFGRDRRMPITNLYRGT